jgi:hypothetical protein
MVTRELGLWQLEIAANRRCEENGGRRIIFLSLFHHKPMVVSNHGFDEFT